MNGQSASIQEEIEKNLAFFLTELPNIPSASKGKIALLRHQQIVGYYDTVPDAINAGAQLYSDGLFSIQQVTDAAINLGFFSYAMPLAAAQ